MWVNRSLATMRRFAFLVSFFLCCAFTVSGQYDAQISQYMFASETFNPAMVASNGKMNLFGLYRMQWVGIDNAPRTMFFDMNAPVKFMKHDHGLGLIFEDDKAGLFTNQSVYLQYAYKYKLGKGLLSFGINLGFVSQTFAGDSVHKVSSDYHEMESDPAIPTSSVNDMAFDFDLGTLYEYKDFYAGFSVFHLFEPTLNLDEYVESFVGRSAFLTAGYDLTLPNNRYGLSLSSLIKTDFVTYQYDLNAILSRDDKYMLGLGWRLQDGVIFLGGINLDSGVSIVYSFDLATTKLISYSYGSHELSVRYSFLLAKKKPKKYKSVRIL